MLDVRLLSELQQISKGVIAASGTSSEGVNPSPMGSSNAYGASSSDLEDMVNDILT
ncbi:MAG: hypothetical protein ACI4CA_05025 [Bacteroides sp.]